MNGRRPRFATAVAATAALLGCVAVPGAQAGNSEAQPVPLRPYHWPVKPFDLQDPIRSGFGEPRTLAPDQPFGRTGPDDAGAYSFHNGVDIAAPAGTPVYPVVSGRAVVLGQHEVVVHTHDGRSFQYDHLDLAVLSGQTVVAQRTILGSVIARFGIVHFGEIDTSSSGRGRAHNPLAPGHLEPYRDHTRPTVSGLYVDDKHGPRSLDGRPLEPRDRLVVAAIDAPVEPVPGPFFGLPQVPALVEWRLLHRQSHTAWQVAADFRTTEPLPREFWKVYAPGTYQNCPVFASSHFNGAAGRYLFHIRLDLNSLRPGRYRLETRVADIRHNRSTAYWRFEVGPGPRRFLLGRQGRDRPRKDTSAKVAP